MKLQQSILLRAFRIPLAWQNGRIRLLRYYLKDYVVVFRLSKKSKKNWGNCATAYGTIKPSLCRTSLPPIKCMNFQDLSVLLLAVFYNQQIIFESCYRHFKNLVFMIHSKKMMRNDLQVKKKPIFYLNKKDNASAKRKLYLWDIIITHSRHTECCVKLERREM